MFWYETTDISSFKSSGIPKPGPTQALARESPHLALASKMIKACVIYYLVKRFCCQRNPSLMICCINMLKITMFKSALNRTNDWIDHVIVSLKV